MRNRFFSKNSRDPKPGKLPGSLSVHPSVAGAGQGAGNFFSTFFVFELDFSGIGGKLNSIVLQMGY